MLSHHHFLKQIQATPADPLPRLIYADWLEEQGDPGGELIRIEQEIYRHPPWSDRYTELRIRRRELLPQVSEQFRTDLDLEPKHIPLFSELPEHWEHRWRLYEAFFDNWGGGISPADCETEELVARTEARLEIPLPASLQQWLLRGGPQHKAWNIKEPVWLSRPPFARGDRWRVQNDFLLLGGISPGLMEFEWAIRRDDLKQDDPPVCVWHPFHPVRATEPDMFSELVLRLMLEHLGLVMVPARAFAAPPESWQQQCLEQLQLRCRPVVLRPIYSSVVNHRYLEFRELFVDIDMSCNHITIRARTREICVNFLNLLGDCRGCFGLSD